MCQQLPSVIQVGARCLHCAKHTAPRQCVVGSERTLAHCCLSMRTSDRNVQKTRTCTHRRDKRPLYPRQVLTQTSHFPLLRSEVETARPLQTGTSRRSEPAHITETKDHCTLLRCSHKHLTFPFCVLRSRLPGRSKSPPCNLRQGDSVGDCQRR